ncbi:MAG: cytochrome P460 family protein [Deltaproteobacteria bacterium]
MLRARFLTLAALALLAGIGTGLLPARGSAEEPAKSPGFGVTIPEGYRSWQVVAPSHRIDKDEIRVILGNGTAMQAYRAGTLPFPDGSILAKLAWKRVKSSTFDPAYVPGEPQRIEFMVKDSKRYASTGGWGFGRFVGGKAADEQQHGTCFPCHQARVPGNDFVFTRYAP